MSKGDSPFCYSDDVMLVESLKLSCLRESVELHLLGDGCGEEGEDDLREGLLVAIHQHVLPADVPLHTSHAFLREHRSLSVKVEGMESMLTRLDSNEKRAVVEPYTSKIFTSPS